jgi:hypothetical protein
MDYRPITNEEFERVKTGLLHVLEGQMRSDAARDTMTLGAAGFYSVPFEEVGLGIMCSPTHSMTFYLSSEGLS